MAEVAGDLLNLDNRENAEAQRIAAVQFAQHYFDAFVRNPAGRVILEHWTRTIARKAVPVDSSIQKYAAAEAVRAFIEGINAQIQLAQTEGK